MACEPWTALLFVGDDVIRMKDRLDNLSMKFTDLTSRAADKLRQAQDSLPLVQNYHASHERLTMWMDSTERQLKNLENVGLSSQETIIHVCNESYVSSNLVNFYCMICTKKKILKKHFLFNVIHVYAWSHCWLLIHFFKNGNVSWNIFFTNRGGFIWLVWFVHYKKSRPIFVYFVNCQWMFDFCGKL